MPHEPDYDQLCPLEQEFLLRAIEKGRNLRERREDAIHNLHIVLVADQALKPEKQLIYIWKQPHPNA